MELIGKRCGKELFDFIRQTIVPDHIEGLLHIKEYSWAVFFFSKEDEIVLTSLCTCCIVECFARNPNWAFKYYIMIFYYYLIGRFPPIKNYF